MKAGERWMSKKIYGPKIFVHIVKVQNDSVEYKMEHMAKSSETHINNFKQIYEKDWSYEIR